MKNAKKYTSALFFVLVLSLTIFSGCEKDDENSSSPGYFILDGKKHDLVKAYFRYFELEDNGVPYFQNEVYFLSAGITIENEEASNGDMVLFECQDPLNQQIPGTGEYKYLSDSDPVTPYTYFGFLFIQGVSSTESKDYWLRETVKVKKSGDVYEFSASGKTKDGEDFEFYYKGTLVPTPSN